MRRSCARACGPALAALCAIAAGLHAREDVLESVLPVSGPEVVLARSFLGHHHPGAVFVMEGEIRGADGFEGGVRVVQEPQPDAGPQFGQALAFRAGAPAAFRFPVRAPAEGAPLNLEVYRNTSDGGRQVLFRAPLTARLEPVGPAERVVLACGEPHPLPAGWHVTERTGAQLPEETWAYESVDLVVLGRGAFQQATESAQAALRAWLLGGGRVLITGTDALIGAVRAGLLPVKSDLEALDAASLIEALHLTDADVVRDPQTTEVVFARFQLGFGGGIFFFEQASAPALRRAAGQALGSPVLEPHRPKRPDATVWSQPFDFFANGAVGSVRRRRTAVWATIGAVCLLALLAYTATVRTRYLSAGLALGGVTLLTSYLAGAFPAPEAVVSRVALDEYAADGRALRRTEFAYLDAQTDLANLEVAGPAAGTLCQVYYKDDERKQARVDLSARDGLRFRFRPVYPAPLPPLFRAEVIEPAEALDGRPLTLPAGPDGASFTLRGVPDLQGLPRTRLAVWVPAQGPKRTLKDPFGSPKLAGYEGDQKALRDAFPALTETDLAPHAQALAWALAQAAARGRGTLVFFEDAAPGASGVPAEDALVRFDGLREEAGPRFRAVLADATLNTP